MASDQGSEQGMLAYAAPSLFQPHRARQAIRDAHEKNIPPLLGYFAAITSIANTRFLAPMGFDCVWLDWEHTSCNVETMTTLVHEVSFFSGGRTIPFVRVPGHDHAAIGYALDAGASLIIPQVDTVEQAKHCVSAARFGTKNGGTPGSRSAPPFRLVPSLTDTPYDPTRGLYKSLNDQAAIMIQIESYEGIENLDAILTEVPDIDIVWLGTLDCRVSMNLPIPSWGSPTTEPEWLEAVAKFEATLKKHNKPYGGFCFDLPPLDFAGRVKEAAETMSLIMVSADALHLLQMNSDLAKSRQAVVSNQSGTEKRV